MTKETSTDVAAIAGELLAMSDEEIAKAIWDGNGRQLAAKIRSVAATALGQHEPKDPGK